MFIFVIKNRLQMPVNIKYFVISFLFFSTGFSQVEEIIPPDYIKTIYFNGGTSESQLPIIPLGESLVLEFDALNGDEEDYYYEIKHYNFDWTPSILVESEYDSCERRIPISTSVFKATKVRDFMHCS